MVGTLRQSDAASAFAAMASAARRAARGSVTTVWDLGDRDYLSLGLREAPPTVHFPRSWLPAHRPPRLAACHFLGTMATGVLGLRAAVRAHADRSVDVIMIMASGGDLTEGSRPELP